MGTLSNTHPFFKPLYIVKVRMDYYRDEPSLTKYFFDLDASQAYTDGLLLSLNNPHAFVYTDQGVAVVDKDAVFAVSANLEIIGTT